MHKLNGRFQTNGKANLILKFFDYSTSREYFIQPDVLEYKDPMDKPGFDLIFGSNTMKELERFVIILVNYGQFPEMVSGIIRL